MTSQMSIFIPDHKGKQQEEAAGQLFSPVATHLFTFGPCVTLLLITES